MDFRKHAIILAVIEALHRHGSWTGKTHVQKALSLLRDARTADVPFQFVLYKHGPYSFDIEDELEQMQSYGAIAVEPNPAGYGVVLQSSSGARLVSGFATLMEREKQAIEEVCEFVGNRTVGELERLATASWIRSQEHISDAKQAAERLHTLKPHIPIADAEKAYREITEWRELS